MPQRKPSGARNNKPDTNVTVAKIGLIGGLIALIGVIATAVFGYLSIRSQVELPIQATQTAVASMTQAASSAAHVPEPSSTLTSPPPATTSVVAPTAAHIAPSPTSTPVITNILPYCDPDHLGSITATNAADPERPRAIKITFDTSTEGSWCIWEARLDGYDASKKTSLSFWVRGKEGGEQFQVGIKDSTTLPGNEPKVKRTASAEWQVVPIRLQELQAMTQQNLSDLENFSLSFTHDLGSGTIYVDEFVFVP